MAIRPHLSLPELARRYLAKEPHSLDPEERKVLETFKERRPISRDAADIEEAGSTILVPHESEAEVDNFGNYIIRT